MSIRLKEVRKIIVKKDEIIVLKIDSIVDGDAQIKINKAMKKYFPDNEVLVLDKACSIEIIDKSQVKDKKES